MSNTKFMFFANFKSTADKLPDDLRLKFYDALTDYVFNRVEPEDPVIAALISAFKPSLDKKENRGGNHNPSGQNQHSEVKRGQKRSKEVKNNNLPPKEVKEGQSFLEEETEEETEEEKDNLKVIQKEKRFTKPTVEEIKSYSEESGNRLDPQRFFDFYESKGWKVGNSPMKDWKAAVRNWCSRERTLAAANGLIPKTGVKSGSYGEHTPL